MLTSHSIRMPHPHLDTRQPVVSVTDTLLMNAEAKKVTEPPHPQTAVQDS